MTLDSEKEQNDKIKDVQRSRGAKNAGRTKVLPLNSAFLEALKGRNIFEEIPRTGIDKYFKQQNEETKFNIYGVFNQPPILNGITKDGMFNQDSFVDAFHYYNSITEKDRQELERIFNSFLPFTIWGISNVEIEPLSFKMIEEEEEEETTKKQDNGEGDIETE